MQHIVGREGEKALLSRILKSGAPELVAVYGRRRIGKTFLIRSFFAQQIVFEFSGMHRASFEQQLENFTAALTLSAGLPVAQPQSWIQAFNALTAYLTPIIKRKRHVIFFDEFPWINTPRSGFLQAFENFWNMWASRQKNLVVVICGSAAAWMIQKVVNNKGGLHNRVTRKIRLLPFTIGETALFLKERKITLDKYQLLQIYMVMGGIPHYLKEIQPGKSAMQNIDNICFTRDGLLHEEFTNLFRSLFDDSRVHIGVIRALAKKPSGLTRNQIISACKFTSGGGATQLLEELAESGFITTYLPFGKKAKDCIYKLTDEYSLFYLKFIENSKFTGAGAWTSLATGASWKSWSGLAFESVCMKHTPQLKKALGISGVHTETSMCRYTAKDGNPGAQIDLLIDRQDQCINICEIKFSTGPYELTKNYATELANKLQSFRSNASTRKTLFLTMVTTYGVKNAGNYAGLVTNEITMDALFEG